ncbi:MAG: ABC transporter ATP-binding protein/permease [Clostridia bacterium]|nr:ABC transporter ATP-binding protein/permease [Clostridia bacterium]
MLQLKHIVKTYETGGASVKALNDISIEFRNSEFVSILGHSGCGKTTLLNLIGGLDHYTDGDLIIRGKSTKQFKDADWDAYRNHSVGFVFQSYNLIPHQSVLSNVELALTLSGVSKAERRQRAIDALTKVGLADQIHKRPNQMSGGQMQRVAIARALVNDPDILLADEPTGALDSATSVQIMEILKEISKDKLIVMVTHNPELAEAYSTRIVKLQDGVIVSDSMPYDSAAEAAAAAAATEDGAIAPAVVTDGKKKEKKSKEKRLRNKSMSYLTAISLSLNNLMTKKGRTILTSFAGSIGIIGIALILSLSNGINLYIAQVQEDALSTYPLTLQENTQDYSALLGAMTQVQENIQNQNDPNKIYVDDSMDTMVSAMTSTISNNLEAFKAHMDKHSDELGQYVSDIQYTYNFDLQVFSADGKTQVSPTKIFDNMGSAFSGLTEIMESAGASGMNMGMNVMSQMIDNRDLLNQQYDVIAGEWPAEDNEVVLVVSRGNRISKMVLYMLGVLDQGELEGIMNDLLQGGKYEADPIEPFSFDDFLGMEFKLLNTSDFFEETNGTYPDHPEYHVWNDVRDDIGYDQVSYVTDKGVTLKISGIICPKENATATSIQGAIGYTKGLTDLILEMNESSKVINQQKAAPEYNVLTGLKFERTVYTKETIGELIDTIDDATMEMLYAYMTEQVHELFGNEPPVNAETFMGFAYIMDAAQHAQLVEQMLAIAKQNPDNATSLQMLCGTLTAMMENKVQITPDNLLTLLPAMTTEQIMVAIAGVPASDQMPMAIPGLQQMCGETAMEEIYAFMNTTLLEMSVDEVNFVQLLQFMSDEEFNSLQDMLYEIAPQTDATLDSNLTMLGDAEKAKPATINFYAKDFEAKEMIEKFITDYNNGVEEKDQLSYTDVMGILLSSVTTIVDFVSYALIAFVSISLVVSSIMIGIITYISVLERTKEIGILRAIGASKRDISRVFNAETLIVGFAAGAIGIIMTLILCIPANMIFEHFTNIERIAVLPLSGLLLIVLSVILTMIAGFFPSKMAAKKDPVEALRTE